MKIEGATIDLKQQAIRSLRLARQMLKAREARPPKGAPTSYRNSLTVRWTDDAYGQIMRQSYDNAMSASTFVRQIVERSLARRATRKSVKQNA